MAAKLRRLLPETRDRVLERACILHFDAGIPFPQADEMALELEGTSQRRLVGT